MSENPEEVKIEVYLDDGRVFWYEVANPEKAREHTHAIATSGYRHTTVDGILEHYPSHRILKIKARDGITTSYPDKVRGT